MAKKFFIPPPVNVLDPETGTGNRKPKDFFIEEDPNRNPKRLTEFRVDPTGIIPDVYNLANRYLPFPVPIIDINDLPVGLSPLGTLVMDNITFVPGRYANTRNRLGIPFRGLTIDTVVFEANQTKNIVKTTVQGRNRTVKEYVSAGDINISVTGQMVNSVSDHYPTRDVITFLNLMAVPSALSVRSKFIQALGVKWILVESFKMIQQNGKRNTQAFTMSCVADVDPSISDITGEPI